MKQKETAESIVLWIIIWTLVLGILFTLSSVWMELEKSLIDSFRTLSQSTQSTQSTQTKMENSK